MQTTRIPIGARDAEVAKAAGDTEKATSGPEQTTLSHNCQIIAKRFWSTISLRVSEQREDRSNAKVAAGRSTPWPTEGAQ